MENRIACARFLMHFIETSKGSQRLLGVNAMLVMPWSQS